MNELLVREKKYLAKYYSTAIELKNLQKAHAEILKKNHADMVKKKLEEHQDEHEGLT